MRLPYGRSPWPAASTASSLAGIQAGDKVCVVGGGAIGLIMVQLAKLSGASKIVVSEPNEKRCQVAWKWRRRRH